MSELTGMLRTTNKRLAGLEHEARQPRLATEADVEADKKTRKRTKDASAADREKNGDNSFARRVDDGPMSLTSFGMIAERPAPEKSIADDLVHKGAEVPNPCLSPVEMRTPTATGGLLPAGTASTEMRTIFSRPLPSWTLGEDTKTITDQRNINQLVPPCWRKVIPTKSRQSLMFNPGGCTGRLRGCLFLRGRHVLLSGWVPLDAAMGSEARALC